MKIFHFHNGTGGGVLSVIRNLVFYQQDKKIEQQIVYTINTEHSPGWTIPKINSTNIGQLFSYSPDWNFYHTCKQLAKLLPDEETVIVAHDWMELGMVSHLGLSNPVVMVLHGDYEYYYRLAVKHAVNIDIFICIAANIAEKLRGLLPHRKADIYYQRFPVREEVQKTLFTGVRKLLFVGRCEKAKGYHLLPLIEQELQKRNCQLIWTIVGDGQDLKEVQWPRGSQVNFLGEIPNDEVLKIVPDHDLILLPSLAEGMPVSVIEAMKAGVVPLVNNISGGIQELVENNVTGYKIENNNPEVFAERIKELCDNSGLLQQLAANCISRATDWFNPEKNALAFEMLYQQALKQNKPKKRLKVYGSRLDQRWIPNVLVHQIRKRIKNKGL